MLEHIYLIQKKEGKEGNKKWAKMGQRENKLLDGRIQPNQITT